METAVIATVAAMVITRRMLGAARSWYQLVKRYRARRPSLGRLVHATAAYIGETNYGPLITFRVSPRGLYMEQPALLNLLLPSVMVPWSDITVEKYVRMPLFKGYDVTFGTADPQVEPLQVRLPDKVVQAARMFIDVPELERPH